MTFDARRPSEFNLGREHASPPGRPQPRADALGGFAGKRSHLDAIEHAVAAEIVASDGTVLKRARKLFWSCERSRARRSRKGSTPIAARGSPPLAGCRDEGRCLLGRFGRARVFPPAPRSPQASGSGASGGVIIKGAPTVLAAWALCRQAWVREQPGRRRPRRAGGRHMARCDQRGRFGRPGEDGLAGDCDTAGSWQATAKLGSEQAPRSGGRPLGRRLREVRARPRSFHLSFCQFDRAGRVRSRELRAGRSLGLRFAAVSSPPPGEARDSRRIRSRWRMGIFAMADPPPRGEARAAGAEKEREGAGRVQQRARGHNLEAGGDLAVDFSDGGRRRGGLCGRQRIAPARPCDVDRRREPRPCILGLGEGRRASGPTPRLKRRRSK